MDSEPLNKLAAVLRSMSDAEFQELRSVFGPNGRSYDEYLFGNPSNPVAVLANVNTEAFDVSEFTSVEVYATTADIAAFVCNCFFQPAGSPKAYLVKQNRQDITDDDTLTSTLWVFVLGLNGSVGRLILKPTVNASFYVRGVRK